MHFAPIPQNSLSTLVLNHIFENPCLDCENNDDTIIEKGEDDDEIYYEEPDLSGGVEGIDYGIVYGIGDEEVELEAEAQT